MRIEIEKQINEEIKEIWAFNMFDLNLVFVYWCRQVKPKGKRKWFIEKVWDKYTRSNYYSVTEPILPEIVRSEALSQAIKYIRVYTWDEWKKK